MQIVPFTDQMNRQVQIPFPPKRIISLVPSQTELLFDLGLDAEVVGITKFCIHPKAKVKQITKIGGTKKVDIDLIRSLKPDLIIGNKEENDKEQIEALMSEFNVWMSDIHDLEDALEMISEIGKITSTQNLAQQIRYGIESGFEGLLEQNQGKAEKIAYFIWKRPYMVAGTNTFISDILHRAGWENAVTEERYPEINAVKIKDSKADRIFLSSEPYPFRAKHLEEFQLMCPDAKVSIVDGEMFSWYGSHLLKTPGYLQTLSSDKG